MTLGRLLNPIIFWLKVALTATALLIVFFGWFGFDLQFGSLKSSKSTQGGAEQFVNCKYINNVCVTKIAYGFPLNYYHSATEHVTYSGGPADPVEKKSVNLLGLVVDGGVILGLVVWARRRKLFNLQSL